MTYTISYNPGDNIIEVKVQGDLTLPGIKAITAQLIKVSKEQNCLFILNDLREATIKLSTMQIYELPNLFSGMTAASGLEIFKLKRAFVAPKGQVDLSFFETVTVNRGQNVKYFFDVDEARKWLLRK